MKLGFRAATQDDFADFYHGCFYGDEDNQALRAEVEREWYVFAANPAGFAVLIEDNDRDAGDQVVGYAQTVFVSDDFVTYLLSDLPPYANQHASRPLPDGSWPLLTLEQVRKANSGDGLNALTTRWGWREAGLDEKARLCVRGFLNQTYALFYQGYNYKRLLIQSLGEWACQGMIYAGYRLVSDYANHLSRMTPPPRLQAPTPTS